MEGLARCAKVDVNKENTLINEFALRRVPHFVMVYQWKETKLQHSLAWKGRDKVNVGKVIDAVASIFPIKCTVISSTVQMATFLEDVQFDEAHFNAVKAVVFSNAKKRQSPHILLQYIATTFADSMKVGYVHLNSDRRADQELSGLMAQQIGLDAQELEPPSMYILRSPLIHKLLMEEVAATSSPSDSDEADGGLDTLEDVGIYHIALSSDVDSMRMFVEQYSVPLIPKMDSSQYLERCFFSDALDGIAEEKICYLFLLKDEEQELVERTLLFGQFVLGSLEESVQFGWINCLQQQAFCANILEGKLGGDATKSAESAEPKSGESGESMESEGALDMQSVHIVAVKAFQDHYHVFAEGVDVMVRGKERGKMVQNVVEWISILEREDDVFGASCSDDNGTGKCGEGQRGEVQWTEGMLFPIGIRETGDSWDGVLGGFGSVLGIVGAGVSGTVSTVSTIISAIFQGSLVLIIFLFLIPMLRMAGNR